MFFFVLVLLLVIVFGIFLGLVFVIMPAFVLEFVADFSLVILFVLSRLVVGLMFLFCYN